MGLDLLAPWNLALLGLLVPLVVLYILKVRRETKKVPSTWLWASAERDLLAKSPFRRLVPQIPLFLQALVLILLALALSRPASRGESILGDHVAIVIDASASMSAKLSTEEGAEATRLDAAKGVAKDVVAALPPGSDAMVLVAGRDARLASPLDRDRLRVQTAIEGVVVQDVEGDLGAAVSLAVDRLQKIGGSSRVVVVTDGYLAHPGALASVALPVDVLTVGEPIDNAGIVRVDVRTGFDPTLKKEQVQAFLMVHNTGRSPRDLFVTMRQDNASDVLASRRILVPPGERQPVVLTFFPSRGDYDQGLVFEISPGDALAVDDRAFARVPSGQKLPVVLTAPEGKTSAWLERALVSDPMVELYKGKLAEVLSDQAIDPRALVVVEKACPERLPGGDLLVVAPPPGPCFGTEVGPSAELPLITSWDEADPRLRFLGFDGVQVATASALVPGGPSQALVRTQTGAIITDISSATRFGTLVGFDVGDSNWPLKASFVLFVRNIVEQARAHRAHGIVGPARTGEPIRAALPTTAVDVEVLAPDGKPAEHAVRDGMVIVAESQRAGLYRFAWQGPQGGAMVVPANLASELESDLAKPSDVQSIAGQVAVRAAGEDADAHNEWTWLLALLALGFVVADVWYLTRGRATVGLRAASVGAGMRVVMPERRAP